MKQVIKQQWLWFAWQRFFAIRVLLLALLSVVIVTHGLANAASDFELGNRLFDRMHFLIVYYPISMLLALCVQQIHLPDVCAFGTRQIIVYQRLIRLIVIQMMFWLLWSISVVIVLLGVVSDAKVPWGVLALADQSVFFSQLLVCLVEVMIMVACRNRVIAFILTWVIAAGFFLAAVNHGASLLFAFSAPQTAMHTLGNDLLLLGCLGLGVAGLDYETAKEGF